MQRVGFLLKVRPDMLAEYKAHHQAVWTEMLEALRRTGQRPRAIVLRMEQVPYIDATGANALATFTRQAKHSETEVWLCGLQEQPREFLAKSEPRFAGARRASTWPAALKRLSSAA